MLSPYRVLDLTNERGELAAMVLGDLGADVIKIEPPAGSSSRRLLPFLEGAPEGERSLHYFAFNRNKRSVTLDLASEDGRAALLKLTEGADFLFESSPPGTMAGLGLGFDDLRRINPTLVYVAITPFGQDGPYAEFAASDLTLSAMGGQMALQGDPERPPVRITVPQAWLHAASEASVAALVAHALAQRTGEAQFVDVSAQAAVIWTMMQGMVAHAIQGRDFNRMGGVLQLGTIALPLVYECADGHVVAAPNGAAIARMVHWFAEDGIVSADWIEGEDWRTYDIRLLQGQQLNYSMEEVIDATRRFLRGHTKEDLMDRGLQEGVTIAPVNTVADLSRFKQLEARGFWLDATLPGGKSARVPGLPAHASEEPLTVRRWAPRVGEHTAEVLAETPRTRATVKGPSGDVGTLPFSGLKVVDFTWLMAGPVATKYLADHGATVVRVETANPPCRLRAAGPYKDGVPGANRSQFFGDFNTSKLSISLDLKNPAARDVVHRLIAWADVCVENFTPGTMDDLGIGYEAAREINPSIIFASSCLMGQTGPAASFAGYGYHAAAIAGYYEITGWPDLAPAGPWSAYTDVIAPRFFATTIMAALDRRLRTGRGERIDLSQLEAALTFLAPQLIDYQASGHVATRDGNRSPAAAPHAAYPCAAEDQWCAIAVESDEQWRALRAALGDPEWARDTRYDRASGRLAAQDDIDARLSDWTRERAPYDVMRDLQAAGVPAGVAQRSSDLINDAQLAHRGFHRYLEHPEMGTVPYNGHQFRIAGYDSGPRFPAPCLGQHNEQVMREILGMSDEQMAEVLATGALV